MLFSGLLPPFLLRRLRAVLQLAIPAAVVADSCRSVVVIYHMLQERLQVSGACRGDIIAVLHTAPLCAACANRPHLPRAPPACPPCFISLLCCTSLVCLQEWEEEDRQDIHREVRAMLQGVAQRCAAKNPDFWPPGLPIGSSQAESSSSASGGALPGPSAAVAAEATRSVAADIWQLMGLSSDAASAGSVAELPQQQLGLHHPAAAGADTAAAISAWARQEKAQLVHQEQAELAASISGAAQLQAASVAASAAATQRATLVVVTLQDALEHVAASVASLELPWSTLMAPAAPPGVVHVTLSDVLSILGSTPPAQAAASKRQRLSRRILEAADATGASMRASLPWPQLHLSRKSALRWGGQRTGVLSRTGGTAYAGWPTGLRLHSWWPEFGF
jgi:hypothetical protein